MANVFITGVRGKTGAPLARELMRRGGVRVIGGSSTPDLVEAAGAEVAAFSWDSPRTWDQPAVVEADAIYLVRPDRADAPELIASLLSMVGARTRVVLLSELDRGYFGPDDWSVRVESAVRDAGQAWTILQPGWFMQVLSDERFFLPAIRDRHVLPFPSNGRSVAWIDARDIADVAAHVLLEPGHDGETYELTGPESLDFTHVVDLLTRRVGHPIDFEEQTLSDALGEAAGFQREIDNGAFDRIRRGMAEHVTHVVEQVTGRPARTFDQFLREEFPVGARPS